MIDSLRVRCRTYRRSLTRILLRLLAAGRSSANGDRIGRPSRGRATYHSAVSRSKERACQRWSVGLPAQERRDVEQILEAVARHAVADRALARHRGLVEVRVV